MCLKIRFDVAVADHVASSAYVRAHDPEHEKRATRYTFTFGDPVHVLISKAWLMQMNARRLRDC